MGSKTGLILTLCASIITIFIFISGKDHLAELFISDRNYDLSEKNKSELNEHVKSKDLQNSEEIKIEISKKLVPYLPFFKDEVVLIKEGHQKTLIKCYVISEAVLSPDNKKLAAAVNDNPNHYSAYIYVINVDGSNHHKYYVDVNMFSNVSEVIKNITWISNDKLRAYLSSNKYETNSFRIESFPLKSNGTYDLTLDKFNTLVSVNKFR